MAEEFTAEVLDRVVKAAREAVLPPWKDEDGEEWYVFECPPGSPGAVWSERHPEAAAKMPVREINGRFLRLIDPKIAWADLKRDGAPI